MKRLYEKSENTFAIVWIIIYVVSMSFTDSISEKIGIRRSVSLPALIAMSVYLYCWVRKNHLGVRYGFCGSEKSPKELLFYIPLILTVASRLVAGIEIDNPKEILLQFVSMLFVGFLEELIFRGFLFRSMAEDGIKSAVIVSALTFGIGHAVNLINGSGQSVPVTILQIVFAILFGFCMVFLFYYGGSLWPCVITHGVYNALGAITNDSDFSNGHISVFMMIQMVLMGGYAYYLWRRLRNDGRL